MNAFLDTLERALWTYLQALAAALIPLSTLDLSVASAAAFAAIPAGLTVLANGLPIAPDGLPFFADMAWRTGRTFAASFLGYLVAQPFFSLEASVLTAAATAGITAALVVFKAGFASRVGDHETASTLPARFALAA